MVRMSLFGSLLAILTAVGAHAQELDQVVQVAGTNNALAVDGEDNRYVTGAFRGTVTFGSGEVNETTLESFGPQDIFVARYEPGGELTWVRQAGDDVESIGAGTGEAIDFHPDGKIGVAGTYFNAATFGAGEAGEITFDRTRSTNIFHARYATDGALDRAVMANGGEPLLTGLTQMHFDGSGNAFLHGAFMPSIRFWTAEGHTIPLSRIGLAPARFVAGLEPEGGARWAHSVDSIRAVSALVYAPGRNAGSTAAVVAGQFVEHAFLGPGASILRAPGTVIDVIARFDTDGNVESLVEPAEPLRLPLSAIALEADGNLFLAGGNRLEKRNAGGEVQWAEETAGSGSADFRRVFVDELGDSYVLGSFEGTVVFGAGEPGQTTLASDPGATFIAKYGPEGDLQWATVAMEPHSARNWTIVGNEFIHLTGNFNEPTTFGPGQANAVTLMPGESGNGFIARYRQNADPSQLMRSLLAFFDGAVADGRLAGTGQGRSSEYRLEAVRNMLVAARDLIDGGYFEDACGQLQQARQRADGESLPPDFAEGEAALVLTEKIQGLSVRLACL